MSTQSNIYNEPEKKIPTLEELKNQVKKNEEVQTGSFSLNFENSNHSNGYKYVQTPRTILKPRNPNNIEFEAINLQNYLKLSLRKQK